MPSRIPRSEAASMAQSTKAPAGWFARVALRVAVDQQRRRRARPPKQPFQIEPRESSPDPEMAAIRAEERRAISAAIDRTARNRDLRVLRLHLGDGMGPTEI